MDGCDCLEHIYGWLRVDVIVLNTFVGLCAFLEYFHGWVWVGVTVETHLWVGVPILNTFMGGCGCL